MRKVRKPSLSKRYISSTFYTVSLGALITKPERRLVLGSPAVGAAVATSEAELYRQRLASCMRLHVRMLANQCRISLIVVYYRFCPRCLYLDSYSMIVKGVTDARDI